MQKKQIKLKSIKSIILKKSIMSLLIPLVIGTAAVAAITYFMVSADKVQQLETESRLVVANLNERLSKYVEAVELHAKNQNVTSMDAALAEPYLQEYIARQEGVWSHFLLADESTNNIAHTEGSDKRGVSIGDKTYFNVPWYDEQTDVSQPTYSNSTGRKIIGIGVPVYDDGEKVGVIVGFLYLQYLSEVINSQENQSDSYTFMLNADGTVSAHPNEEIVLVQNWLTPKEDDVENLEYVSEMSGGFKDVIVQMTSGNTGSVITWVDGIPSFVHYEPVGVSGLSVATVVPVTTSFRVIFYLLILLCVMTIFTAVFASFSLYNMSNKIAKPLISVTNWARSLAIGDTTQKKEAFMQGVELHDEETHTLVAAFEKMSDSIGDSVDAMREIAAGNLDFTVHLRSENDVLNIAIDKLLAHVSATMADIDKMSKEVSSGAAQISSVAQNIAGGCAMQETAVVSLSASMQDMSDKFEKTDERLNRVTVDTSDSTGELQSTYNKMQTLLLEIRNVNVKSSEVALIIKAIEDIAFQTNILALNAAVEAARAGDAGKGFAVVADEVRNLAIKSSEAAKTTADLIDETVKSIAVVNDNAEVTMSSMESINERTKKMASDIKDVYATVEQERILLGEIVEGLNKISAVVQQNTTTSKQSATGSEELYEQADTMKSLVSQFKLKKDSAGDN